MTKENHNNTSQEQLSQIDIKLAELCNTDEKRQQVMRLIMEILNADSIIRLDANDIIDTLSYSNPLTAIDVSVSATATNRMNTLVEKIKEKTSDCHPFMSLLVYLFFPEDHPLLMAELQPLIDWLPYAETDSEIKTRWGMAHYEPSSEGKLRAIVLVVTDQMERYFLPSIWSRDFKPRKKLKET